MEDLGGDKRGTCLYWMLQLEKLFDASKEILG